MLTNHRRKPIWPGLAIFATIAATLACSPGFAHEVHDAPEQHQSGAEFDNGAAESVKELVTHFRQTGNDRFLDEAWALIEPSLVSETHDPGLLIDAALVAQARHHFELALDLTQRALAQKPVNDQGWLLLASIHLVRGNAEQAASACRKLRQSPLLVAITCNARVALAGNDAERAGKQLSALLGVVDASSVDAELLAWSLSVAGDLSAAASPDEAVVYYERSLQLAESTQVRAALVDVLIGQNRTRQALRVLNEGAPALPLAVRRLIVARCVGDLDTVNEEVAKIDLEFQGWIADEDWLHAREMARFYIDVVNRPALARRLALINVTLQREPEDLRLERRTRRNKGAG